jgi:SAM-dependent methyltransferase
MPACPICTADVTARFPASPYWHCEGCGAGFRSPPLGIAAARAPIDASMSERDRAVNRALASWLFEHALGSTPGRTLDAGCGYPFLAHCFAALGCEAHGLDADARVLPLARALAVPVTVGDFTSITDDALTAAGRGGRFRLVTLVHVFDRLPDPAEALRKLRRLVADDGRVFLRMPDSGVAGVERFMLAPDAAPWLHAFSGLLELCVRAGDLFSIERTHAIDGAGQRDVVLRPLARRPRVIAGLIVKNEERDLPRCLESIEDVVDEVVVVDTGSTDRTLEVAVATIGKPVHVQTYTGASRQDASGDWKLWDFGKARNVFVDEIDRRGADWALWMDADDELVTPGNLRRAFWWDEHDVYGVQIESAGQYWVHHRLWKARRGIRFEGRCHEYPTIGGHPTLTLVDSVIRHDATPGAGEGANARNLRILTEEFAEAPTPRVAFYLGSTHKDAGRWREAIEAYGRRIAMGEAYRDEWLFAYLYKARCERMAGDVDAAERTLLAAVAQERSWGEYWTELSYIAYDQRRWQQSMGYALQAVDTPPPPTMLWREPDKYADQPSRMVSLCHEQLGDARAALAWAHRARRAMAVPEAVWEARTRRLEALVAATG